MNKSTLITRRQCGTAVGAAALLTTLDAFGKKPKKGSKKNRKSDSTTNGEPDLEQAGENILRSGERLNIGQFLQSGDRRFRLYLTPAGDLRLYAYVAGERIRGQFGDHRVVIYPVAPYQNGASWPTTAGSGAHLELHRRPQRIRVRGTTILYGRLRLLNSNGTVVWSAGNGPGFGDSSGLFVQNDGNLVVRGANGHAVWSSGSHARANRFVNANSATAPENAVAILQQGTLAIDTTSNYDIRNNTDEYVSVRDATGFVTIPPNETAPAATSAGSIQLQCFKHSFNLVEPSPAYAGNSSDATVSDPITKGVPNVGRRGLIQVGGGGNAFSLA